MIRIFKHCCELWQRPEVTQSVAYLDNNLVFWNNEATIFSKIAVNCSIAVNEVKILQGVEKSFVAPCPAHTQKESLVKTHTALHKPGKESPLGTELASTFF